ncbi:hypothetical protein HDV06_006698 [Boothiomyces sp. JEL0866]|nr:hypothetical protein HDV06_006698 [Boothiomyces sp. JEL0866]
MSHFIDAFDFDKPKQSCDLLFDNLKSSSASNAEIQNFLIQKYSQEEKSISELEKHYLKVSTNALTKSFVKFELESINQRKARNRGLLALSNEFKSYVEGSEWAQIAVLLKKNKYESSFIKQTKDVEDKQLKVEKYQKQPLNDKTQKKLESAIEELTKAKQQWSAYATTLFNRLTDAIKSKGSSKNTAHLLKQSLSTLQRYSVTDQISNELAVDLTNLDAEEYIYNVCQEKGNKDGRADVPFQPKSNSQSIDNGLRQSDLIANKLEKLAVDADGHSIATPHKPNYSITGSLTPSNAAVVDAEGYTIKPHNGNDLFKSNFGDDEEFQRKVINVSIQEEVIREDENVTSSAIKSINEQLQKPSSIRKSYLHARMGSAFSESNKNGTGISDSTRKQLEDKMEEIESVFDQAEFPTLSPTFEVYISETLNVIEESGVIEQYLVAGEISFALTSIASSHAESSIFKISNVARLEKFIVNPQFVDELEIPGEFKLKLQGIQEFQNQTIPIMKYQVKIENIQDNVPIILNPVWRFTDTETNLLIAYQNNQSFFEKHPIEHLTLNCPITKQGDVGQVVTQPVAIWDLDARTLLWDISKTEGFELHQIIARLECQKFEPEPIVVDFIAVGLLSEIELSSDDNITLHVAHKKIKNGAFGAKGKIIE